MGFGLELRHLRVSVLEVAVLTLQFRVAVLRLGCSRVLFQVSITVVHGSVRGTIGA